MEGTGWDEWGGYGRDGGRGSWRNGMDDIDEMGKESKRCGEAATVAPRVVFLYYFWIL